MIPGLVVAAAFVAASVLAAFHSRTTMVRRVVTASIFATAIFLTVFLVNTPSRSKEQTGSIVLDTNMKTTESPKTIQDGVKVSSIKKNEDHHEDAVYYTESDAIMLAKLLYNECRGIDSVTEQACVVWTVLNRVDAGGGSIAQVVTAKSQFAYSDAPVWDNLLWIAKDVLARWNAEQNGDTSSGRVLPQDYKWFIGDGKHNYFRNKYDGEYDVWDYSLPSPYES